MAIGLPAKADGVNLGEFYVGKELLATVNDLWAAAEVDCTHECDVIVTEVTEAAAAEAAVAATNNAGAMDAEMLAEVGL